MLMQSDQVPSLSHLARLPLLPEEHPASCLARRRQLAEHLPPSAARLAQSTVPRVLSIARPVAVSLGSISVILGLPSTASSRLQRLLSQNFRACIDLLVASSAAMTSGAARPGALFDGGVVWTAAVGVAGVAIGAGRLLF